MKAFRYSLDAVLRIRQLQEDRHRGALAAAAAQRRDHQADLARIKREIEEGIREAPGLRGHPMEPWMMAAQDGYLTHRRRERRRQEARVREAEQAEQQARRRLLEARRETRTCELHRERAREAWIADLRRDETDQLDEAGVQRHHRRREAES